MDEPIAPGVALEGYVVCADGCGRQVLEHVAHLTGGQAWHCFEAGTLVRLRTIEVEHRRRLATVVIPQAPRSPRKASKGRQRHKHLSEHAKRVAQRRLVAIYRDVYDVLVDDERVKRKLLPLVRRVPRGAHASAVETLEQQSVYAAGLETGARPDAEPEEAPPQH